MTTPHGITSVEEVDTLLTSRRVDFVGCFETWQYSDTSHMKLCARHLSQDAQDELAGVLPTASWTKKFARLEGHTVPSAHRDKGTIRS